MIHPTQRIPIDLPPEERTAIIRQASDDAVEMMLDQIDRFEGFPGLEELKPRERLAFYVRMTHPLDLVLLEDGEYTARFLLDRQMFGQPGYTPLTFAFSPPPGWPEGEVPFWESLLEMPSLFEETRKDFLRLADAELEKQADQ